MSAVRRLDALVTGVSHGIGRAIARRLAQQGCRVIGMSRSAVRLEELARDIERAGGSFLSIRCDLEDRGSLDGALRGMRESGCQPTILVNNAGYGGAYCLAEDVSDPHWNRVLHLSAYVPFRLAKELLPYMRSAMFGRIVNIGSVLSSQASPGSLPYIAAKHALLGITRSLAVEYGRFGVTSNLLALGYLPYAMSSGAPTDERHLAQVPSGKFASVEDVAACVAFLCTPGAASINGASLAVDGGLLAGSGSALSSWLPMRQSDSPSP